jgi:hypothetical protein
VSAASQSPYVGLEPFSREHARYFFGRVLDAKVITNNVLTRPITVLFGAGGVGKSSILAAGMPSALEAQFGPVTLVSRCIWHRAEDDLGWLRDTLNAARVLASRPLIIVLDQFEEYFLYRPKNGTGQFERELADALGDSSLGAHLLLSLRADALHLLDQLRLWLPGILDNTIELEHLDERGVRDAIERPVEVFNTDYVDRAVHLGAGFADDLLADMQGALKGIAARHPAASGGFPIELPFLQLTLHRLWKHMRELGHSKLDGALLRKMGGVSGIVRTHLQGRLDSLNPADQLLAARLFHYLVTPSGGKIAYTADDLASLATESWGSRVSAAAVQSLLAALATGQARILRRIDDGFELFHDVLARPILDWRVELKYGTISEKAAQIPAPSSEDSISLKNVALLHTSFLPKKKPRFNDGRVYLQIEVIVIAPDEVMEKIASVTYRFDDAYPPANRVHVKTDHHDRFKVKELANGTSIVRAEIKFIGQEAPIHLNRFIDLRLDGPRI